MNLGNILKAAVIGAAIATGVGALAMPALVAGSTFAGLSGAAAYFAQSFAINAVLGFVSSALAPKPKSNSATIAGLAGQAIASKNPIASRKIAYGRTRTSGTIVFQESTGNNNDRLHQIVTLAGHEISAVDELYFNDIVVKSNLGDGVKALPNTGLTPNYNGKADFTCHYGKSDQTADSDLVSDTSITANHRLRGIAYVRTKMIYKEEYSTGVPNVSAVIKGKKVYDPRSGSTAYSNNAALCILDYLRDDVYGLGAADDEIDFASFQYAANVCDENVTLDAGGTEKRYTINGIIDTADTPAQILDHMVKSCAGTIYYTDGQWHLKAGEYVAPSYTLTADDFVGSISIDTRVSNQSNFNAVKGVFVSGSDNWQPVDFPPITSSTFEAEDGGERRYADMVLPLTTSSATAQRIAKIALYRNREQVSLTVTCKLTAFKFDVGDTLMIDLDRYGWDGKVFEVLSWQFAMNGLEPVVVLQLKETSEAVYNWSTTDESALTRNNTTLPNPFVVGTPTNLSVTQLSGLKDDGTYDSSVVVTWDRPADGLITHYEVQWKRGAEETDYGLVITAADTTENFGSIAVSATETSDFGLITETPTIAELYYNSILTTDQQFVITNVNTDNYTVRVRAVNGFGIKSEWISDTISPLADTTPPSAPESLTAIGGFRQIRLNWDNPPEADLDLIAVYRNTVNNVSGATFIGHSRGTTYLDAGLGINTTYYYWVRASDRTGNDSGYSSGASATTEFVDSADFSAEVMNLFSEAGAYGIEPVSSLPASGDFDGQIKFDTTANKLYRWDATGGVWTDDIFSIQSGSVDLASFASGIEPISIVASLPNPVGYTGANLVFLTTNSKIYRYDSSVPEFTTLVAAADVDGAFDLGNFPSNLRPIEVVSSLPVTDLTNGRQVYLTTDSKLYRYNGSAWTKAVATTDLSGTIEDAQIAGVAASKLTTQITETNIADDAISTPKLQAGAVTASEIAANTIQASNIAAGAITASTIAADAITADKIATGAVTADSIAAGAISAAAIAADAITADKIQAGAIGTDELAADAVTAGTIAANAITSEKIATDAITAGKVQAGAIGTSELAAEAVTADEIKAGTITSAKIKAGDIQGDRIAANTITGGLLATSGIITTAAQIEDAVIENAKIKNGAITEAKIGSLSVSTIKIQNQAVTIPTATYTSGGYNITLGQDNTPSVQSITVSSSGAPILLTFSASCKLETSASSLANGNYDFYARIYRGTTLIFQAPASALQKFTSFTVGQKVFAYCGQLITTPGSGTHTFYLKFNFQKSGTTNPNYTFSARGMSALEVKK